MSIGVDVAGGGGNRLYHQRAMLLHDMKAVTPQMFLADERGGKINAMLLGEEEGGFVVGKDVMRTERWGFKDGNVGRGKEVEEFSDDGLL